MPEPEPIDMLSATGREAAREPADHRGWETCELIIIIIQLLSFLVVPFLTWYDFPLCDELCIFVFLSILLCYFQVVFFFFFFTPS